MGCYIVTYDLNKEVTRPPIDKSIREDFNGFAMLSESSYAITTNKTPKGVYDALAKHLDGNDCLLVVTLSKPYFGQHSQEVIDWLDEQLPD